MIAIDDPVLTGLQRLAPERLRAITGASEVELLRLRYDRGRRAILHLSSTDPEDDVPREGAVWFYPGDKARRLAKRNGGTVFDPVTKALYTPFPHDHRMPEIGAFVNGYAGLVAPLIGGPPDGKPLLVRYRPGLSCTFRCLRRDGAVFYVKLQRDEPVARLAAANALLADVLVGTGLAIARIHAVNAELKAVSYAAVSGTCLEVRLAAMAADTAARQVTETCAALRELWSAPITPARLYDRQGLLDSARRSARMIGAVCPAVKNDVDRIVARLDAAKVRLALRPIHADFKLEHAFIGDGRITLIDTESLSLGPPDYDLAQFYGRLRMAQQAGTLQEATVNAACQVVRRCGAESLDWCLGVVALRLAKFHAQRPVPFSAALAADILHRMGQHA
ncbi:MAG: phosphotransferase [Paracoccaceae bacterium]